MNLINKLKNIAKKYQQFSDWLESKIIILTIIFFIAGIFITIHYPGFGNWISGLMDAFINGYGFFAPLVIFIILAPSLARAFKSSQDSKIAKKAIVLFLWLKFLASFWAVIFTVLIFRFPLLPDSSLGIGQAVIQVLKNLGKMMLTSPYFWAMYASVGVAIVSIKVKQLFKVLGGGIRSIENLGSLFIPFIPLFMLGIGAYVSFLPTHLNEQIGYSGSFTFSNLVLFGWNINPNTNWGMVSVYIIGSLLVGVACFMWQFIILTYTKYTRTGFSIKDYFKKYWIKVYPLLWATSSEALATPLNLYLVKKYYPEIPRRVRRFVIGVGSYLAIQGTMICVFVLAGVVLSILGIQPSFIELVLAIPLVYLISFGVPGIPGELILFAGPLAILLNIPEAIIPVYLAIYIGLQIGLPDSFRTGANSTDDVVTSILLTDSFKKGPKNKKVIVAKEKEPEPASMPVSTHIFTTNKILKD